MTKNRKRVLEALKRSGKTLSAKELHAKLRDIDLVTIYRALELFVSEKLIREVHLGTDEARFEYQENPHHHAVCTKCEKVIHFRAPNEKLKRLFRLKGFDVDEIEVTVRGVCKRKRSR